MTTMELSQKEERHLLNLSVIPAALVTYLLIACFFYFTPNQLSLSMWDYLARFGIPFAIAIPITIFLSFEILYSRKINKPISYHIKRFLGRMSIILTGILIFVIALVMIYFALISWIDEWKVLLLTGVIWFGIWGPSVFRFKKTLKKLYKGQW
jgi:hypothetical protein